MMERDWEISRPTFQPEIIMTCRFFGSEKTGHLRDEWCEVMQLSACCQHFARIKTGIRRKWNRSGFEKYIIFIFLTQITRLVCNSNCLNFSIRSCLLSWLGYISLDALLAWLAELFRNIGTYKILMTGIFKISLLSRKDRAFGRWRRSFSFPFCLSLSGHKPKTLNQLPMRGIF